MSYALLCSFCDSLISCKHDHVIILPTLISLIEQTKSTGNSSVTLCLWQETFKGFLVQLLCGTCFPACLVMWLQLPLKTVCFLYANNGKLWTILCLSLVSMLWDRCHIFKTIQIMSEKVLLCHLRSPLHI